MYNLFIYQTVYSKIIYVLIFISIIKYIIYVYIYNLMYIYGGYLLICKYIKFNLLK